MFSCTKTIPFIVAQCISVPQLSSVGFPLLLVYQDQLARVVF